MWPQPSLETSQQLVTRQGHGFASPRRMRTRTRLSTRQHAHINDFKCAQQVFLLGACNAHELTQLCSATSQMLGLQVVNYCNMPAPMCSLATIACVGCSASCIICHLACAAACSTSGALERFQFMLHTSLPFCSVHCVSVGARLPASCLRLDACCTLPRSDCLWQHGHGTVTWACQ